MLTKAGAKLLDFGLAKASGPAVADAGQSMLPTTPADLTAQGTILGTFQYMAPEQLEGKEADARTDIFAFGAVLYEMLTGTKAFSGDSHASLISSIMSSQPPPVSTVQTLAPAALDHVDCAMSREGSGGSLAIGARREAAAGVDCRGADIAVLADNQQDEPRASDSSGLSPGWRSSRCVEPSRRHSSLGRAPAPAAEPVQFVIFRPRRRASAPTSTRRPFLPTAVRSCSPPQVPTEPRNSGSAASTRCMRLRSLAPMAPRQPFWSPDSQSVGFFAAGKLKTDRCEGRSAADARRCAVSFGRDLEPRRRDSVRESHRKPAVSRVRGRRCRRRKRPVSNKRTASPLTERRSSCRMADISSSWSLTGPVTGDVCVGALDSNDVKLLLRSNSAAVYSPPGYVLFLRETTLMAQPFDLATLSMRGEAVAVAEGVGRFFMMISFAVSDNGTLIYRSAGTGQTRLAWVNRAGQTQGSGASAGVYDEMALSPDDKRVAFARPGQSGTDVWLTDLDRRITSRFTFRPPLNNVPIWSPDGKQIVFASARDGLLDLYQRASDASGPDELLLKLNAQPILFPSDWSADGRFLTYYRTDPKTQLDIWTLSLGIDRRSIGAGRPESAEGRKPVPFLQGDFNESQGQFSPDGRWIAYVSDESGGQQVYVQSFPTPTGQRQISTEGGTQPRWRRDGKELFYLAPDRKLMAVTVKTGATFEADAPRAMFQTELNVAELRQSYAVVGRWQPLSAEHVAGDRIAANHGRAQLARAAEEMMVSIALPTFRVLDIQLRRISPRYSATAVQGFVTGAQHARLLVSERRALNCQSRRRSHSRSMTTRPSTDQAQV